MSDGGNNNNNNTPAWYEGLDEVHRGHVVARGWHQKTADEAAREAAMAHRQAQAEFSRVHGVPADQLLRMPKDAADPGWGELHKRLGVPETPDAYKFDGVKFADGTAPDDKFLGHMRALAHELKLPADRAAALAQRVIALGDSAKTDTETQTTAQRSANDVELRRAWGPNHDYFRFQVSRAAQILGVPEGVMQALETRPGAEYVAFMDKLRGFAGKMGEAELLRGEGGGSSRVLTRDEAVARMDELRRDQAWTSRLLAGDADVRKEFENLTRTIVGPAPQAGAR